ncbi:MAG: AI-2E family transporter [Thermoleophilaceae bacterium]|nr:AI-2E family transporter [Thermoleophilaceae bacterium]
MGTFELSPSRSVARTVLIIVAVLVSLYLVYLLRKPLGWLFIATFLAVALAGPVNFLERRMKRGFAITLVYLGLMAVPVVLGTLMVPPLVNEASNLAEEAPQYANDVTKFVKENGRLRNLDADYDLTGTLREQADKLPSKLGGAAGTLRDVGLGLVNSIFALVTILILTAFMLGGGRRWIGHALRYLPEDRAERMERVLRRSAAAVGNYVAGALAQATLAGILSFVVLSILGVPFAAPLSLIIFFLDLIPLVGATIGAVAVGLVTLFTNFPTATIVWLVWSIVYQQVENNVIQPQIQRRAVSINPFLVIVAVLFGSSLLGVLGALVAVPMAASIQIAAREYMDFRGIRPRRPAPEELPPPEDTPPPLPDSGDPGAAPA